MRGPRVTDEVDDHIVICGRNWSFRRPRSAEDLIDEEEYARDERLPYWAELWPSGVVLAERVAGMDVAGLRIVELGCGLGLPTLVAMDGGAEVLATDWYAEALELLRRNAHAALGRAPETMTVDWRDPPQALLARPPAHLVIGADLLYEERNGDALAALLPRLVRPDGVVVIADPRRPHADRLLAPLAAAGWTERREEVRHAGRVDEAGPVVRLHTLRPPSPSAATGTSDTIDAVDPR